MFYVVLNGIFGGIVMFRRDGKVYFDRSGHYANAVLAYVVSFTTLVILVLGIVGVAFFKRARDISIYSFVVALLLIGFCIFCNYFFVWAVNGRLEVCKGYLVYKYEEVVSTFGNSTVEVKIKSVDRVKRKRKNFVVYGDLSVKQPLRKEKGVKKYVLANMDDDAYIFFSNFYNINIK